MASDGEVAGRLRELGIALPDAPAPAANYAPFAITGKLVFVSGQLPFRDGTLAHRGKLGRDLDVAQGSAAARQTALNVLAVLASACGGSLERVSRCVKLCGFVNCTEDFTEQPAVMNGASDLLVQVLGERGKHARVALGASALPLDAAVEIDAVFELA